jgi:hypothetical protein
VTTALPLRAWVATGARGAYSVETRSSRLGMAKETGCRAGAGGGDGGGASAVRRSRSAPDVTAPAQARSSRRCLSALAAGPCLEAQARAMFRRRRATVRAIALEGSMTCWTSHRRSRARARARSSSRRAKILRTRSSSAACLTSAADGSQGQRQPSEPSEPSEPSSFMVIAPITTRAWLRRDEGSALPW